MARSDRLRAVDWRGTGGRLTFRRLAPGRNARQVGCQPARRSAGAELCRLAPSRHGAGLAGRSAAQTDPPAPAARCLAGRAGAAPAGCPRALRRTHRGQSGRRSMQAHAFAKSCPRVCQRLAATLCEPDSRHRSGANEHPGGEMESPGLVGAGSAVGLSRQLARRARSRAATACHDAAGEPPASVAHRLSGRARCVRADEHGARRPPARPSAHSEAGGGG